ncbi:cysteine-rich repeat secretory protein 55-like [Ananas comosus]|uniref:Cysteine-rich repeat secretory protein 55-like n=1 Tax=Ananas comosus TaxID=4615 RepID=A0A6P5EYU6_ANACO|nr:cysteine-rich repeat secretory protein 55-like [Ananas comosus]
MALTSLSFLSFFFLLLPFSSSSPTTAASIAATDPIGHYCASSFKGTQTQANINLVLSDLVAKASIGGFAVSSFGGGNGGAIYGLAQCRGDVIGSGDCLSCLVAAAKKLPTTCAGDADGRIWYDYCFMRYDNVNFVGKVDIGYEFIYYNVENATDPAAFDAAAEELLGRVQAEAATPGNEGFAEEKAKFTGSTTIYGLAQCTQDLQPSACGQCLAAAAEEVVGYCQGSVGCQVHYSSCMLRYEIYPFYFSGDHNMKASAGDKYFKVVFSP